MWNQNQMYNNQMGRGFQQTNQQFMNQPQQQYPSQMGNMNMGRGMQQMNNPMMMNQMGRGQMNQPMMNQPMMNQPMMNQPMMNQMGQQPNMMGQQSMGQNQQQMNQQQMMGQNRQMMVQNQQQPNMMGQQSMGQNQQQPNMMGQNQQMMGQNQQQPNMMGQQLMGQNQQQMNQPQMMGQNQPQMMGQQNMMNQQQPQLQPQQKTTVPQQQMNQPQMMGQQNMMNQQPPPKPQQRKIPPSQPSLAQPQQPKRVGYMNPTEIPLFPLKPEDFIYPQPQPFQKPVFNTSQLPPALQNDIQQNELRLSNAAFQPLEQLTGQKFHFFADYEHVIEGGKCTPQQKDMMCTLICGPRDVSSGGGILPIWIEGLLHFFNTVEEASSVIDPKFFIKKFLDACYTRHFTVRWRPKTRPIDIPLSKKNSPFGVFRFVDGVCEINMTDNLGDSWVHVDHRDLFGKPTGTGTMQGKGRSRRRVMSGTGAVAAHYPFAAIEQGTNMYGCLESYLYFTKHMAKYQEAQESLKQVFGCYFNFEVDAQKIFDDFMDAVKDPKIDTPLVSAWCGNFMEHRQYHLASVSGYFVRMAKRMIHAVTCNEKVDQKLVDAFLRKVHGRTIEMIYTPREEGKPCKWFELHANDQKGSLVMQIYYFMTNLSEMFKPGVNYKCIETLVYVDNIPILAYKNLHEKSLPKELKAKETLLQLTGKEWNVEYKMPLTHKKLLNSDEGNTYKYERFPEVLSSYFVQCSEVIAEFAKKIEQVAPNKLSQPQIDDDLDSDEEEEEMERTLVGKEFPFTIQQLLHDSIPTNTIVVKWLNKLKSPIEPWHFTELKDGKLIVKIIKWFVNVNTVFKTDKTGFQKIMMFKGAPVQVYLDNFHKFAQKEVELNEEMGKLLGGQAWTFQYDLAAIWDGLRKQGRSTANQTKQVGYQFGNYYTRLVDIVKKMSQGEKSSFAKKFDKRIVKLIYDPPADGKRMGIGRQKIMELLNEGGILVVKVHLWMVNVAEELRKVTKL